MATGAGISDLFKRDVEPTLPLLLLGAEQLRAEIEAALSSPAFAYLDNGSETFLYRLYDAAALRHCSHLLGEIGLATGHGLEMAVRCVGRTHIEAWLFGLYIHFGGHVALTRLIEATKAQVAKLDSGIADYNQRLACAKKAARRKARKIRNVNDGIATWNASNPGLPPKRLVPEAYIPNYQRRWQTLALGWATWTLMVSETSRCRRSSHGSTSRDHNWVSPEKHSRRSIFFTAFCPEQRRIPP